MKWFLKATKTHRGTSLLIMALVFPLLALNSCAEKKPPAKEMPPRPVHTAIVIQKDVPIYIDSFGFLSSPSNIDIRSQVTGKIQEVHFNEGDAVKKGDLLFSIDPSEYQADLDKATAQLTLDEQDLKLKKDLVERNKRLVEQKLIAEQDFEKYQTDAAMAEARIKVDHAMIEKAKIDLDYCSIEAPADGITGKRQVDPGNIVTENSGPVLVNIKMMDPLYVDFTIIERDLARARSSMEASKLSVEIIADGKEYAGTLQFLDNAVDDTTGTVSLRAVVSNPDKKLWAGEFVKVRLILGTEKNALLVPYETIQIGRKGYYLFVVTPDNKADLRNAIQGSRQDNLIVVKEGVKSGEKVVTVGQMGLSPGATVIDVGQQSVTDTAKPESEEKSEK